MESEYEMESPEDANKIGFRGYLNILLGRFLSGFFIIDIGQISIITKGRNEYGYKKINVIVLSVLITAWFVVFVIHADTETPDEQLKTLIGEWKGVWPGHYGDSSTLIIHEIDDAKAKARCTYIVNRVDSGKSEHEVSADFFPGPSLKLEFKREVTILSVFL